MTPKQPDNEYENEWEPCMQDGCNGVRVGVSGDCLAHVSETARTKALRRFTDDGVMDARGVPIDARLLRTILDAAPRDPDEPQLPFLPAVRFDHARFGDGVDFAAARFGDHTQFTWARFGNRVKLYEARFGHDVRFNGACFGEDVDFRVARFGNQASFEGAQFGPGLRLWGASFGHGAQFTRARFGDSVRMSATFEDAADFGESEFGRWARLYFIARGIVRLKQATFAQGLELGISSGRLDLTEATFTDGGVLQIRWADVVIDRAGFHRPTVLSMWATPPPGASGSTSDEAVGQACQPSRASPRPRLTSVHDCDLQNLTVSDTDLRACRFARAHNLDGLRLQGTIDLPDTPAWQRGLAFLPFLVWRWTRRQTLADEHVWRSTTRKGAGWLPPTSQIDVIYQHDSDSLAPTDIAKVYRALRKGREDSRDEPGAADFYYGEMEMRRQAAPRRSFERLLLGLYWLVSGYGLRASRTLGALLVVVVAAGLMFAGPGFQHSDTPRCAIVGASTAGTPVYRCKQDPQPTYRTQLPAALAYSAESTTSLLHGPDRPLTAVGEWTQVIERLLGPLLFGLTVLSLRGRVKR